MKKFFMMNTKYLTVLLIGVIILLYNWICSPRDIIKEKEDLISSLTDSINYFRDSEGKLHAKISVIETEKTNSFLQIKSKDSVINQLQALVKEYKSKLKEGSSITKIGSQTKIKDKQSTSVVKTDTVIKDSIKYVYQTYYTKMEDKWYGAEITANKDTTTLNLTVRNEYDIILGREGKWYQKKKSFVEVINHNPHTEIPIVRTYKVKEKSAKRVGLGFQVGYGPEFPNLKFKPYVGVGINYNIVHLF